MARIKIDYGIDLGTTNSVISRMDRGEAVIIKSDTLKDTMPSCVYFNRKQAVQVGDAAMNNFSRDKIITMKRGGADEGNGFIEFKRTMGTDKKYFSPHMKQEFSSEELSAEVLKTLRSFVTDEDIKSVIITVPAAFKANQIDATRRAAELAGFPYSEFLQEPVAAAMAYGLVNDISGYWLVFDFGGGTFDVALLEVKDGITKVVDTDGDNYLGGKNLDLAILDEVLLPEIRREFNIESYEESDLKLQSLKNILKIYVERAKIALSFNDAFNILTDLGDLPDDDNGDEIELDITLTQDDMRSICAPYFQKTIDITKNLLERNNITANNLASLVLVGGSTYSPILREMLEQQIKKPDTSIDPMTVVSRGAALYASTVSVSDEVREQTRDQAKIQLEIGHEATSVEEVEFVTLRILEEKTSDSIPSQVFAEITRSDKSWSSGKVKIDTIGEIIDVLLKERTSNLFDIVLYDASGTRLECEPSNFTIIQGTKIGSTTLYYNFGIEVKGVETGKAVFKPIQGLEKNKSLPATGVAQGLRTPKQIRPGMSVDYIKIPLYQGENDADGTRAAYNEHVYDIIINGDQLPRLLPENSEVQLTVRADQSQRYTVEAYFPFLDHTEFIEIPMDTVQKVDTKWLHNEINKAQTAVQDLIYETGNSNELKTIESSLDQLQERFDGNTNDVDTKMEVLSNLRKELKKIDEISVKGEWPKAEQELRQALLDLEKANEDLGDDSTYAELHEFKNKADEVVRKQDIKLAARLTSDMISAYLQLTMIYQLINIIRSSDSDFYSIDWKDTDRARELINQGLRTLSENPTKSTLRPIAVGLINLMPDNEGNNLTIDSSLLIG